jgi:hypothetical protein
MSNKVTYLAIAVVLLVLSMVMLYVTGKYLDVSAFFYGVFAGLGLMVAGWVMIGLAYKEKKKEKAEVK